MYQAALVLADVAVLNLQRFLFIRADHNLLSDATTHCIVVFVCLFELISFHYLLKLQKLNCKKVFMDRVEKQRFLENKNHVLSKHVGHVG